MVKPFHFFEEVFFESKNRLFESEHSLSRFSEETAQAYYLYLRNDCDLEHDEELIQDWYKSTPKLKATLNSHYNSERHRTEKAARLRDIRSLPWEDRPNNNVDDFIREFTNIVNTNIHNPILRLKYIRYMADYVRICGEGEAYKNVMHDVEEQARNL